MALPKEIEIKLRVEDIAELLRRLVAAGAKSGTRGGARSRSRVFEHNVLFDLPGQPLRKRGALLRLRWRMPAPIGHDLLAFGARTARGGPIAPNKTAREPSAADPQRRAGEVPPRWKRPLGDALLTYKGRANARGGYKVADELETAVEDPETLTRILRAMGFHPSFRYEKFRTELHIPRIPGLAVDLDETPLGNFVELEGSRKGIDRAAALLGRSRDEYLTGSYATLQRQFCRRQDRSFGDMLFPRRKE
jgi:adenylate cyclase class IV